MAYKNIQFPAVGCRIFLSYGPYQDFNRLIPQVIYGCLKDLEFPVSSGIQYRDFCYIDDVINAFEALIISNKSYGKIYNIGSAQPIMVKTIIKKINKNIGKGKPIFGNNPLRKKPKLITPTIISYGGNEPIHWKEQSTNYMNFLNQNGFNCKEISCKKDNHFSLIDTLANNKSTIVKEMIKLSYSS